MKYLDLALLFIIIVNSVLPRVAEAMEPRWHQRMTTDVHGYRCNGLAFSPDGRLMVSVGSGPGGTGEVKLWGAAPGREIASWVAHSQQVKAVAFSPDAQTLATGGGPWNADGEIKFWNVGTRKQLTALPVPGGGVLSLAFAPNGQRLAVGNGYFSNDRFLGRVTLWDLPAGEEVAGPFELLQGEGNALAFSPDGNRLATSSGAFDPGLEKNAWELALWDSTGGKPRETLFSSRNEPVDDLGIVISSVAFSPDGKFLAAGGRRGTRGLVRLWDVATGGIWATLPEQPGVVWAVAFSPDSKRLATAGNFQPIKLWDAAGCQEVGSLDVVDGGVFALAFSPDGQQFVAGGSHANQMGDNQAGFISWWSREEEK